MKKSDVVKAITACVAADATKTATRLYIENRISKKVFDEAWSAGLNLRKLVEKVKYEKDDEPRG